MISTYHASQAGLLGRTTGPLASNSTDLPRLLADATRYQLAARVLREAPGPYPALTRSFPDLVGDLLTLDSELAEHLVRPEDLRAYDAELLRSLEGAKLTNADLRKVPRRPRPGVNWPNWWAATDRPSASATSSTSATIALSAAWAARRGRGNRPRRVPGGAAGRVPGHLGGPAHPARGTLRRRHRPSRDRGRRPLPGHLRLARRSPSPTSTTSPSTSHTPTAAPRPARR